MPIVRFIKNEKQNPSAMKGSIDYCLQKCKTIDSQTGQRYVSGINCNGLNAYKEFMTTKLAIPTKDKNTDATVITILIIPFCL